LAELRQIYISRKSRINWLGNSVYPCHNEKGEQATVACDLGSYPERIGEIEEIPTTPDRKET
jgi:hypothetical protein